MPEFRQAGTPNTDTGDGSGYCLGSPVNLAAEVGNDDRDLLPYSVAYKAF
jgi:hypothetical protein